MELFSGYETLIGKLDSLSLEYYLLGDLNCNLASSQYDLNTRLLCEISDMIQYAWASTEPTRNTETLSTLIDLIYTNHIDRVDCSGVAHIGISDHTGHSLLISIDINRILWPEPSVNSPATLKLVIYPNLSPKRSFSKCYLFCVNILCCREIKFNFVNFLIE